VAVELLTQRESIHNSRHLLRQSVAELAHSIQQPETMADLVDLVAELITC
jgi:hypothetical protein